jgi:hypothetical protein
MSESAISNRLSASFNSSDRSAGNHRSAATSQVDIHKKLSIQAKQNALPKGTYN